MFDLAATTFATATVTTESGSVYTVIIRKHFVVLVHEDGWTGRGTDLHIINGSMFLRDNDRDVTVARTTKIKDVYVLEN
jgi:hypothetical protein